MTVEISDVKHLQKVIKSLRQYRVVSWMSSRASAVAPRLDVISAQFELKRAITSISTRASLGSRAAWTVARAGAGDEK